MAHSTPDTTNVANPLRSENAKQSKGRKRRQIQTGRPREKEGNTRDFMRGDGQPTRDASVEVWEKRRDERGHNP